MKFDDVVESIIHGYETRIPMLILGAPGIGKSAAVREAARRMGIDFEWVDEQGITPDVFLYFTDLYGKKPDSDPGYPVLWVRPTDKVNCDKYLELFRPTFGRLIQID